MGVGFVSHTTISQTCCPQYIWSWWVHWSTFYIPRFSTSRLKSEEYCARQDTWERPLEVEPEVKIWVIVSRPKQVKWHPWWEVTKVSQTTRIAKVSEEEGRVREEGFQHKTSLTSGQMLLPHGSFLYTVVGKGAGWPAWNFLAQQVWAEFADG